MAPQNVSVVLSEALGRGGAAALPYAGDFRQLLSQHISDLVLDMPSLHVKTRDYTHIDGRTVELLLAEGTVPMYYQGVKYNIPVAIWLPERYPLAGPLVYVVPTPDMVIKPRHSFVEASGLVSTLYIAQWQYPTSNLREMAQDMSMHFGGDPPLFSKPKNWTPPPPPPQTTVQPPRPEASPYGAHHGSNGDVFHAHNPLTQGPTGSFTQAPSGSFTTAGSAARPPAMSSYPVPDPSASGGFGSVWDRMMHNSGASQPPPPQQEQQQQQHHHQAILQPPLQPAPPKENPGVKLQAAFRTAAEASLNKRLHASLSAMAQQAGAEAEEQRRLQAMLRQRGEQLQCEVAGLQAERVALDKLSQDLAASNMQLDRWLAENEHLARAAEDPSQLDPDLVISAADPLSQQALEVQAQDLALEDTLYALDKSLNNGAIEPVAYLKQVRALCRRQFFVRTIGNKVAAAQQEQQRRGPPPLQHPVHMQRSLSTGRPVVLPQGDSWANAGIISSSGANGWPFPAS